MTYSFTDELASTAADIEQALDRLLAAPALATPGVPPDRLVAAMRHGSLNGGKRLRPLLVRQAPFPTVQPQHPLPGKCLGGHSLPGDRVREGVGRQSQPRLVQLEDALPHLAPGVQPRIGPAPKSRLMSLVIRLVAAAFAVGALTGSGVTLLVKRRRKSGS